MTDAPAGITLIGCTRPREGLLTVTLQLPAPPDESGVEARAAAAPPTVLLHDIAGHPLEAAGPVATGDAAGQHICHFLIPPAHPLADAPSYLLTVHRAGAAPEEATRIWVAPSDPPAVDPTVSTQAAPRAGQTSIDYTVRDFTGFCTMMRARMAQNLGGDTAWALAHPADPLMTVAEILAARGDYLSYQQDSAGTEAYLSTARRRLSVRRHARLLDYAVNDGCNARTWLAFVVGQDVMLPAGLLVVTPQPGRSGAIVPQGPLAPGTIPFETMEPLQARRTLSDLGMYLGINKTLPAGTCSFTLNPPVPSLTAGRVLVFQQTVSPDGSSQPFGAFAVRLLQVKQPDEEQQQEGVGTEITWHPEDVLPRTLVIPKERGDPGYPVLYGNVVLADHGLTGAPQDLDAVDDPETYRPSLAVADPVFAAPLPRAVDGWNPDGDPADAAGLVPSATASLVPDPRTAVASVVLTDGDGRRWQPMRDLLRSPAEARHFAVEPGDSDPGSGPPPLLLHFGDGTLGRQPLPGTGLKATARTGLGQTGQVKPGALVQIVSSTLTRAVITSVVNPLPAMPVPAESTAAARLCAPTAFRVQRRGVTQDDWIALAYQHPLVRMAKADPPPDQQHGCHVGFEVGIEVGTDTVSILWDSAEAITGIVKRYLQDFAVFGAPPTFGPITAVDVDISLSVYCHRTADIPSLRRRLSQRIGTGYRADGTPAFFNPERLPPGRSVILAELVAVIEAEPGVRWVNVNPATDPRLRFTRSANGRPPMPAFLPGEIPIGATERARLAGDPQGRSIRLYVIPEP
jgi:hypothetical protein